MNIGLIVAYNGTPFAGWQRQPGLSTIQGELENALTKLHSDTYTEILGASRTDSGVHAQGQLACFRTHKDYSLERWFLSLNALTPPDIQIRKTFPVSEEFIPRFESKGKHYRYLLWEGHFIPPALQNWCMRTPPLNVQAMQDAANYLVGKHDFSAFRAADCQAKTPVRRITQITVQRLQPYYLYPEPNELSGSCVQIDVFGEAFLKQMVRIIVGTLLEVGREKQKPTWVQKVLQSGVRNNAGDTAQAKGLTLLKVFY